VIERMPHLEGLTSSLLEFYVEHAVEEDVDSHPLFDSRSYIVRHPNVRWSTITPMEHYVRTRGTPRWMEADCRSNEDIADELQALEPPSKLLDPVRPLPEPSKDLPIGEHFRRFLSTSEYVVIGSWPQGARRRSESGRAALYAAYTPDGRISNYHRASLKALKSAGYIVIFINGVMDSHARLAASLEGLADLVVCRSPGGRDFASWLLTLRLLYDQLAACEHVLFMNDTLVGPFDNMEPLWKSLQQCSSPWWGLTDSYEGAYHVQTALFAVKQEVTCSAAFRSFISSYRFPFRRYDIVQDGELGLSRNYSMPATNQQSSLR
jgi:hypothetical protein